MGLERVQHFLGPLQFKVLPRPLKRDRAMGMLKMHPVGPLTCSERPNSYYLTLLFSFFKDGMPLFLEGMFG